MHWNDVQRVEDFCVEGERQGSADEDSVDQDFLEDSIPRGVIEFHEGLQHMDGRDADQRHPHLDLQGGAIEAVHPAGTTFQLADVIFLDKGRETTDRSHDDQVPNHGDIYEAQNPQ